MKRQSVTIRLLCAACLSLAGLPATYAAGEPNDSIIDTGDATRYVTRSTMYGAGWTNVFDTYLSPQEYKGVDLRVSRESTHITRLLDGNVSVQSLFQADVGYTRNRAENNKTISGLVNWNYGLHYQFRLTPGFKLLAGGLIDTNLGFVYNLRNGNNPASARAYVNLDLSGMAIWHLHIKHYPMTLRYQVNAPFLGVMFSPHYGQSYYEIFSLGNSSGVFRCTSFHNQPSLRHFVTVDLPVRRAKIRIGYVADMQQAKLNGIKTHTYSQAFMIGFVKELFRIKDKDRKKIPANTAY